MASSDRYTGKSLVVHFIHSGGTADISGEYRTLTVTRTANVVNLTSGSDAVIHEEPTYNNVQATLAALYKGTAGNATYGSVDIGVEGTLNYYPNGTASGEPDGGFPCVVKEASLDFTYDGEVMVNYSFGAQGSERANPIADTV